MACPQPLAQRNWHTPTCWHVPFWQRASNNLRRTDMLRVRHAVAQCLLVAVTNPSRCTRHPIVSVSYRCHSNVPSAKQVLSSMNGRACYEFRHSQWTVWRPCNATTERFKKLSDAGAVPPLLMFHPPFLCFSKITSFCHVPKWVLHLGVSEWHNEN